MLSLQNVGLNEASLQPQYNLSVESNQSVESKRKSAVSRNKKIRGVQNFAKLQCNNADWWINNLGLHVQYTRYKTCICNNNNNNNNNLICIAVKASDSTDYL